MFVRRGCKSLELLFTLAIALAGFSGVEAIAHETQIDETVGGTLHIEPNDVPRAKKPALAWFALTRRGGQPIPLADCDCRLAVYSNSASEGDKPLATPGLKAVDAGGYRDIPAAEMTFPAVGRYELVVTGKPTEKADFQPFELSFEVTVASQ
jgi:hypothetical protein